MERWIRIMNLTGVIILFTGLSEASATTVLSCLDDNSRYFYIGLLSPA